MCFGINGNISVIRFSNENWVCTRKAKSRKGKIGLPHIDEKERKILVVGVVPTVLVGLVKLR